MHLFKVREKQGQAAFTLVELMVAVAIIAVLTSIAVANLGDARSRGRDAKRRATVTTYKSSLEQYFAANNTYFVMNHGSSSPACAPFTTDGGHGYNGDDCTGYYGESQGGITRRDDGIAHTYAAISVADSLVNQGFLKEVSLDPATSDFTTTDLTTITPHVADYQLHLCTVDGASNPTPAMALAYTLTTTFERTDYPNSSSDVASSSNLTSAGVCGGTPVLVANPVNPPPPPPPPVNPPPPPPPPVNPPPPPPINPPPTLTYFHILPLTQQSDPSQQVAFILHGDKVTLQWNAPGATSFKWTATPKDGTAPTTFIADGTNGYNADSGSIDEFPSSTVTYTAQACIGADCSTSQMATAHVYRWIQLNTPDPAAISGLATIGNELYVGLNVNERTTESAFACSGPYPSPYQLDPSNPNRCYANTEGPMIAGYNFSGTNSLASIINTNHIDRIEDHAGWPGLAGPLLAKDNTLYVGIEQNRSSLLYANNDPHNFGSWNQITYQNPIGSVSSTDSSTDGITSLYAEQNSSSVYAGSFTEEGSNSGAKVWKGSGTIAAFWKEIANTQFSFGNALNTETTAFTQDGNGNLFAAFHRYRPDEAEANNSSEIFQYTGTNQVWNSISPIFDEYSGGGCCGSYDAATNNYESTAVGAMTLYKGQLLAGFGNFGSGDYNDAVNDRIQIKQFDGSNWNVFASDQGGQNNFNSENGQGVSTLASMPLGTGINPTPLLFMGTRNDNYAYTTCMSGDTSSHPNCAAMLNRISPVGDLWIYNPDQLLPSGSHWELSEPNQGNQISTNSIRTMIEAPQLNGYPALFMATGQYSLEGNPLGGNGGGDIPFWGPMYSSIWQTQTITDANKSQLWVLATE